MFSVCTEVINKIIMNILSAGLFKPVALWLWFERWDPSNHPLYRCHCGPLERNRVQSCLKTHLLTKFTNDKYSKFVNIVVAWSVFLSFGFSHQRRRPGALSSRQALCCFQALPYPTPFPVPGILLPHCCSASTMNSTGYRNSQHRCISFPQALTATDNSSVLPS